MEKTISLSFFALFVLATFSISIISAAGVSTPYWSTNPLKLQPGESATIPLGLQNMVGTDDITLKATITKGGDIAKLVDSNTEYLVPIGTADVKVNVEVTLPPNAAIGETKEIEISFLQVSSGGEGGFFAVASAFTQRIPVLVTGEPTESANFVPQQATGSESKGTAVILWMAVGIIILLAIIVAIAPKKKRR